MGTLSVEDRGASGNIGVNQSQNYIIFFPPRWAVRALWTSPTTGFSNVFPPGDKNSWGAQILSLLRKNHGDTTCLY